MNDCRLRFLLFAMLLFGAQVSVRGNVFASNIRANDATNSAVLCRGRVAKISYILNEPASGGVNIDILAGTNVVRSFHKAGGELGTDRGLNSFVWDGADQNGDPVPEGFYSLSIKTISLGFPVWTQISQDTNSGNQIYDPYGIAINCNTNSIFYGRVFIGNSLSTIVAGQQTGIYKFNADCSPADEGSFSTGGYGWTGFMTSPWKLEISADDVLYVNDWSGYGVIAGFDQQVTAYNLAISVANWPSSNGVYANLSGPSVTGSGAGTQILLADVNTANSSQGASLGIIRWNLTNGVAATNDTGTTIVAAGPGSDLSEAPWDLAIDRNGAIYTIQRILDSTDPAFRVMRFPPATDSNIPMTNADWKAGPGLPAIVDTNGTVVASPTNTFDNAYGIAVNPDATMVAVAVRGAFRQNGGLVIMDANSGNIITNLNSGPDSSYMDVAWDQAGNVYGTQEEIWRVFSPPGTNQSTTIPPIGIQVLDSLTQPVLGAPQSVDGQFQFTLSGQSNVIYHIESSVDLTNWVAIATNYSPLAQRPIQVAPPESAAFYRARIAP